MAVIGWRKLVLGDYTVLRTRSGGHMQRVCKHDRVSYKKVRVPLKIHIRIVLNGEYVAGFSTWRKAVSRARQLCRARQRLDPELDLG